MKQPKIEFRPSPSRLERSHREMLDQLEELERDWGRCGHTIDDRRQACTSAAAIFFQFAWSAGLTPLAHELGQQLQIALNELSAGRHSQLLKPAKGPSNRPSTLDHIEQGLAHACVEVLRESGLGAKEARGEVARYMLQKGFGKFSTHKLRTLGTNLTGPGSAQHPTYKHYINAKTFLVKRLGGSELTGQYNADQARKLIRQIIASAGKLDCRTDFLSGPGAE